jgi:hypothetical protein
MTSLLSLLAAIDIGSPADAVGGASIHLSAIDIVLAIVYLIGIVAIGLFAAWHHKKKQGAADEYFLAGNSLGWASIEMALACRKRLVRCRTDGIQLQRAVPRSEAVRHCGGDAS